MSGCGPEEPCEKGSEDVIRIAGLRLWARIGITASERALPQRIVADVWIWPLLRFEQMDDDLARTVDYAAVAEALENLAAQGERNLLETLARLGAEMILERFAARQVCVRMKKFPLPQADWVAAECTLRRTSPNGGRVQS